MERRAPSVLLGILLLFGAAVGQEGVLETKAQNAPTDAQRVLSPADLVRTVIAMPLPPAQRERVRAHYSRLPLSFEPNQGQAGSTVKYLARSGQFNVFFTQNAVVFGFPRQHGRRHALGDVSESSGVEQSGFSSLQLRLVGANPRLRVSGAEELQGRANYLVGRDPGQWHVNLPTFRKVRYQGIYPGVDLVYYGNQGELESDFIVAPGGNPQAVKLSVTGAEAITIAPSGDLVLRMKDGELRLHKPLVYQQVGNSRKEIAGGYIVAKNGIIGFRVSQYDSKQALIIDPVLSYSTYLGGNGSDEANAIAVDSAGNAYITGDTTSTNFPTTLGQATGDMFVAKLSPTGTKLYATYVGSTNPTFTDAPTGIGVDGVGNAYVVGQTSDPNLPTTPAALIRSYPGGLFKGFVFSLNSSGSGFNYFTYLGGSAFELLSAAAVDSLGNVYTTGQTSSGDYPLASPFETLASAGDGGMFTQTSSGPNWNSANTALTNAGLVNRNTTVIAADPFTSGTVYAATSESGVIKSTNFGTTWSLINGTSPNTLANLFVNGLALDSVTANKLYVGTGGGGIFVSTDGGANWAAMNAGLTKLYVEVLAADPTTAGAGTLYAGTGGRVWKFTPGTASWSQLPQFGSGAIRSIVVDPNNGLNVYAGFNNAGVFRSTDGGYTWVGFNTGLSSLQVMSLAIDHAGNLYAATRTGGVFLSINGGSWAAINAGLPLSVFQGFAVDPTNTVYVGTWNAGVFRRTVNGASWTADNSNISTTRINALAVDPLAPTNLYAGSVEVEAVVTKLSPTGALVFSSYLGGGGYDLGFGIAIDADNGNVYVDGFTSSLNFPTAAAAQSSMNGGTNGFVAKVNSSGSALTYSTYLGGSGNQDQALAIAADSAGNAYVTGITNSTDFPTLNPTQAALAGAGTTDAFVAQYNSSGQKLFATYLGGEGSDSGNAITVTANSDGSTTAWFAGSTNSQFFPLANPIQLEAGSGVRIRVL